MKCANCGTEFEDGILFCPYAAKKFNGCRNIIRWRRSSSSVRYRKKRRRKRRSMHSGKKDDRNRN